MKQLHTAARHRLVPCRPLPAAARLRLLDGRVGLGTVAPGGGGRHPSGAGANARFSSPSVAATIPWNSSEDLVYPVR